MSNFGVRFRVLRRMSKKSQQKVAELLNVSQSTVAAWETGRSVPDVDMAEKAANALGVTMTSFYEDFLDVDPNQTSTDVIYEFLDALGKSDEERKRKQQDDPKFRLCEAIIAEARMLDEKQLSHALSYIQFLRTQKPSTD